MLLVTHPTISFEAANSLISNKIWRKTEQTDGLDVLCELATFIRKVAPLIGTFYLTENIRPSSEGEWNY